VSASLRASQVATPTPRADGATASREPSTTASPSFPPWNTTFVYDTV
jgi:hypothetical protein